MKWEYRQHLSHCCQNEMSEHILKWFEQWITLILAINVILFPYLSNFLFEKQNNTSLPAALLDLLKRTQHPWCYCDCQARLRMSFGWTGWCQHPASGEMEPQHFSLLQVELGSRRWQQEHLATKCCIPVSLVSIESCVPALSSSSCLQNEWWLLKTQWYLPSFCFPTHYAESNDSDEIEGTECQNELEMASEQSIWKPIVIRSTAQPGLKARDEQEPSSLEHFRKLHL